MDPNLAAFCMLALALTIAPGADMALVAKNAVTRGWRASLLTTFGIAIGCSVHAVASSLGLSAILSRSATAFEVVRSVGALYLIWIGFRTLRGALRHRASTENAAIDPTTVSPHRSGFVSLVEGTLTNVLNPKVALFYLMVLPQFIAPGQDVLTRSLMLSAIHIGFGVVWLCLYAALLDRLRSMLLRPRVRLWFEGIMGGALIVLGGRLALERGR